MLFELKKKTKKILPSFFLKLYKLFLNLIFEV